MSAHSPDPEMMAELAGVSIGHHQAMQEVLGKLRADYELCGEIYLSNDRRSDLAIAAFHRRSCIKQLVKSLFSEEEAGRL